MLILPKTGRSRNIFIEHAKPVLVWNDDLAPPNGVFSFVDSDQVYFQSETLVGLIDKVSDYRRRRGILVGEVGSEIVDYVCSMSPDRCRKVVGPKSDAFQKKARETQFTARLASWVREVARGLQRRKLKLGPAEVQKKRARICRQCPRRRAVPKSCKRCQTNVVKLVTALLRGRQGDTKNLGACKYSGAELRLDTFLRQGVDQEAPGNCWKQQLELCNPQ